MTLAGFLACVILITLGAAALTGIQRSRLVIQHRLLQGAYGGRPRHHPPFGQAYVRNFLKLSVISGLALATVELIRSN